MGDRTAGEPPTTELAVRTLAAGLNPGPSISGEGARTRLQDRRSIVTYALHHGTGLAAATTSTVAATGPQRVVGPAGWQAGSFGLLDAAARAVSFTCSAVICCPRTVKYSTVHQCHRLLSLAIKCAVVVAFLLRRLLVG